MSDIGIGKRIDTVQQRDAIHIAVAPVVADEDLRGGDPIEFAIAGNVEKVCKCNFDRAVGIVDPFLQGYVRAGDCFWMFVKPNTITSLRHDWAHPAFDTDRSSIAEWWLRDFAEKVHMSYEELLDAAECGEFFAWKDWDYDYIEKHLDVLKSNIEIVLGKQINTLHSGMFRCAC